MANWSRTNGATPSDEQEPGFTMERIEAALATHPAVLEAAVVALAVTCVWALAPEDGWGGRPGAAQPQDAGLGDRVDEDRHDAQRPAFRRTAEEQLHRHLEAVVDLDLLDAALGLEKGTLRELNPALRSGATPPRTSPMHTAKSSRRRANSR